MPVPLRTPGPSGGGNPLPGGGRSTRKTMDRRNSNVLVIHGPTRGVRADFLGTRASVDYRCKADCTEPALVRRKAAPRHRCERADAANL